MIFLEEIIVLMQFDCERLAKSWKGLMNELSR